MFLIHETKCKFNLIFSLINETWKSRVRTIKRLEKLSHAIHFVLEGFFLQLH